MSATIRTVSKFCAIFALAVAVIASTFAHTHVKVPLTPELAEYVAMGGSLEDLCGGSGEQDNAAGQKCEACRLLGAAVVPRTGHDVPNEVLLSINCVSFVAKRLHETWPLDPVRLTRAPPQV